MCAAIRVQERFQRKPLLGEAFCILADKAEIAIAGAAEECCDPADMLMQMSIQFGQYLRVR